MTIFFPDVSGYNGGLRIQPNTVAVGARATLADRVADASYTGFRQQAATLGALFFAYHWLNHGNAAAQAQWCFQHVGGTPLMIDAEDVAGNTGYAGPLTVQDILAFTTAYRALGGVVHLVYLPHWYWQNDMGSPDLRPLAAAGLALVSSNYATYSDTGPGWAPYGAVTPTIWQYTDKLPYGGQAVDFNAFRGSVTELRALIEGGSDDMALSDVVPGTDVDGRTVGAILADLENMRNWLITPAGQTKFGPAVPLAGSPLDLLAKLATAPTTPTVELSDADRADIAAKVASALGGKLDQLLTRLAAAGDALNG